MTQQPQGRERNAAQPLGERSGLASEGKTREVGKHERRTAGPDGPSAREVGDTFKRGPAGKRP